MTLAGTLFLLKHFLAGPMDALMHDIDERPSRTAMSRIRRDMPLSNNQKEGDNDLNNGAEDSDDDYFDIDPQLRNIQENEINEEYVRKVTQKEDLDSVDFIQLKVDSGLQSLFSLCELTPNLESLVLDESTIGSVRDIGTGFKGLMSLSLNSCGLYDLDGIGALLSLRDLSACDNYIVDASDLAIHESLEVINLAGNNIANISIADELNSCPKLKSLFLSRNPVDRSPSYRLVISSLISGLERLDGIPVDRAKASKVTNSMLLEAADALQLAEEEMEDEERLQKELEMDMGLILPGDTGDNTSSDPYGTCASAKTSGPPVSMGTTGPNKTGGSGALPDHGSELTHGSNIVLAGNMAAAIRRRTRNNEKNVLLADELGSNYDSYDSPRRHQSRPGSSKSVNSNGDHIDNNLGTIEVLDEALKVEKANIKVESIQFIGEGDITSTYMPEYADSPRYKEKMDRINANDVAASGNGIEEYVLDTRTSLRSSDGGIHQSRSGTWIPGSLGKPPESPAKGHASTSPRATNAHNTAPSAPFKIAADENDLKTFRDKISVNSRKESDDKTPVWSVDRTSTGNRAEEDAAAQEATSYDYDYHNDASQPGKKSNFTMKTEKARFGPKSSYIHKDIVLRSSKIDEDNDYEENIAVSAKARHAMMSSSNRRAEEDIGLSTPAGKIESVSQKGQQQQQQQNNNNENISEHFPSKGAASMAGVSLGFNLQESLAAIDQWVEEMDSDSDEMDPYGEGYEDEDSTELFDVHKSPLITSFANVSPSNLNLHAAAEVENDSMSNRLGAFKVSASDRASFASTNTSRTGSSQSSRASNGERILSRSDILNMCTGYDRSLEQEQQGDYSMLSSPLKSVIVSNKVLPDVEKRSTMNAGPVLSNKDSTSTLGAVSAKSITDSGPSTDTTSSPPRVESDTDFGMMAKGDAVSMSDTEIIAILKLKPKTCPQLKTKSAFRNYFHGINGKRMKILLEKAYSEIGELSEGERSKKVESRLDMLRDVLL